MFRRRKPTRKAEEGENPFLLSFSDFMASLLAIFILIVIVEVVQLKKTMESKEGYMPVKITDYTNLKNRLDQLEEAIKSLLSQKSLLDAMSVNVGNSIEQVGNRRGKLENLILDLQAQLQSQGICVIADIPNLSLRFNSEINKEKQLRYLKFEPSEYRIPVGSESERVAKTIGVSLIQLLSNEDNRKLIDTVFIEGHTDSDQYANDPIGNWNLSANRAIELWRFWSKNVATQDLSIKYKSFISVSGYADTRPTSTGEKSNDRRIEIRFTMSNKEQEDLKNVKEVWGKVLNWLPNELKKLNNLIHAP